MLPPSRPSMVDLTAPFPSSTSPSTPRSAFNMSSSSSNDILVQQRLRLRPIGSTPPPSRQGSMSTIPTSFSSTNLLDQLHTTADQNTSNTATMITTTAATTLQPTTSTTVNTRQARPLRSLLEVDTSVPTARPVRNRHLSEGGHIFQDSNSNNNNNSLGNQPLSNSSNGNLTLPRTIHSTTNSPLGSATSMIQIIVDTLRSPRVISNNHANNPFGSGSLASPLLNKNGSMSSPSLSSLLFTGFCQGISESSCSSRSGGGVGGGGVLPGRHQRRPSEEDATVLVMSPSSDSGSDSLPSPGVNGPQNIIVISSKDQDQQTNRDISQHNDPTNTATTRNNNNQFLGINNNNTDGGDHDRKTSILNKLSAMLGPMRPSAPRSRPAVQYTNSDYGNDTDDDHSDMYTDTEDEGSSEYGYGSEFDDGSDYGEGSQSSSSRYQQSRRGGNDRRGSQSSYMSSNSEYTIDNSHTTGDGDSIMSPSTPNDRKGGATSPVATPQMMWRRNNNVGRLLTRPGQALRTNSLPVTRMNQNIANTSINTTTISEMDNSVMITSPKEAMVSNEKFRNHNIVGAGVGQGHNDNNTFNNETLNNTLKKWQAKRAMVRSRMDSTWSQVSSASQQTLAQVGDVWRGSRRDLTMEDEEEGFKKPKNHYATYLNNNSTYNDTSLSTTFPQKAVYLRSRSLPVSSSTGQLQDLQQRPTLEQLSGKRPRLHNMVINKDGSRSSAALSQKVDSKGLFSNERTFMHWIKLALLLGSMSMTLISFSGEQESSLNLEIASIQESAHGKSNKNMSTTSNKFGQHFNPPSHHYRPASSASNQDNNFASSVQDIWVNAGGGAQVGLFLSVVTMGTLIYAMVVFHARNKWMETKRVDVRYYDRVGPTLISVALMLAYLANVYLTLQNMSLGQVQENNFYTAQASVGKA